MCARDWPVAGRPSERSSELLEARSTVTAIQEHFVLAHECVHAAVARHSQDMVAEFDEVIDDVIQFLDANEPDLDQFRESMIRDEIRAVEAMAGRPDESGDFKRLLTEKRAELAAPPKDRSASAIVTSRPLLREELLCDQMATALSVAKFSATGLDRGTILEAILHGFHNLTSMSLIRNIAREFCGNSDRSELDAVVVRKGLWRTIMRDLESHENSEELHKRFVEITNLHARTVGDQFVFILRISSTASLGRRGASSFRQLLSMRQSGLSRLVPAAMRSASRSVRQPRRRRYGFSTDLSADLRPNAATRAPRWAAVNRAARLPQLPADC